LQARGAETAVLGWIRSDLGLAPACRKAEFPGWQETFPTTVPRELLIQRCTSEHRTRGGTIESARERIRRQEWTVRAALAVAAFDAGQTVAEITERQNLSRHSVHTLLAGAGTCRPTKRQRDRWRAA
jgi:hypothetical protein